MSFAISIFIECIFTWDDLHLDLPLKMILIKNTFSHFKGKYHTHKNNLIYRSVYTKSNCKPIYTQK